MNDLLTKETLAAVIAASPDLPTIKDEAIEVLSVLMKLSDGKKPRYSELVGEIAVILNDETLNSQIFDYEFTASHVGSILRSMGLSGYRTRDGWRYAWTIDQLNILRNALIDKQFLGEFVANLNRGAVRVDQEAFEKEVVRFESDMK